MVILAMPWLDEEGRSWEFMHGPLRIRNEACACCMFDVHVHVHVHVRCACHVHVHVHVCVRCGTTALQGVAHVGVLWGTRWGPQRASSGPRVCVWPIAENPVERSAVRL